jgi:signal transduction histidine kinase/putative methionine-R-sulfoxide reductase with GAF domain
MSLLVRCVIAIENTRLLNELRESLQQQNATADVLKVISRSTFDLPKVLSILVESATKLCNADKAYIYQLHDGAYQFAASYGFSAELLEYARQNPITPGRGTITGRVVLEGKTVHVEDVLADPEFKGHGYQSRGDFRTTLGVPLTRNGMTIGVFFLARSLVRPFTNKEIDLVTTFADQAVIAIENARLLNELRQRTDDLSEALEQQTATSEVLGVISSSPGLLKPVFQAMLDNATRICGAKLGALYLCEADRFRLAATCGVDPTLEGKMLGQYVRPAPNTILGRLIRFKEKAHIVDAFEEHGFFDTPKGFDGPQLALHAGARTLLGVPLLKENELVGGILIFRQEVRPFADKQVELVQNFAAQAVIAIENTRLLNELRQRTDDLSKSLDDLRTAQDRLVQTQKLASLGQLTAGIAHEIKNPLNFVNNFSSVSVELIDEFQEMLGRVNADDTTRGEIAELADTLRDNLDKIVQHGKRADSIVKNMLLHSREGSGERRPVDVNALVEESLNLAYHGARAETQSFNVTLERSFDPTAGEVDAFPQEITRVLLNLISNGFYAATKRQGQERGNGFEPTITTATKSLGDRVEIRIRDNGTGIPPEVREKMFNPFFTTKPAGEGTGLGLSISHDIIVKQHSGSIEVDTELGQFTEFRIILPRTTA